MQIFKKAILSILFIALMLPIASFASTNISGVWKHAKKPAQLIIDMESGLITVKSHDDNEGAAGLTVIKNLANDALDENAWHGKMYNGQTNSYVDVKLTLSEHDILKIFDHKGTLVLTLLRQ